MHLQLASPIDRTDALPMALRKKKKSAAAAATLPDDVVLEILSRVADDVALLFRCAVACKPWRALVGDPSFLRHCWPESARDPASFLGLFGRQLASNREWIVGPPAFVPATRPFFPCSFGPRTAGLLHNAMPLVSRHGLLLVMLSPRDPQERGVVNLALCNMFAGGTCDVLPPLKCAFFGITNSAVLTDADRYCSDEERRSSASSSRCSNAFKVLVIVEERGTRKLQHNLYSFSSSDSSWSAHKKDLIETTVLHSNTAVCWGNVHWLVRGVRLVWNLCTFELSNETTTIHVCLTEISIPHDQLEFNYNNRPKLYVTVDGHLSMLSLRTKSCELDIWTLQGGKESGDGAAGWLRTNVIDLKPKMLWIDQMASMCLCQRSGTVLILDEYIVNLETEVIDKVPNRFCSLIRYAVVPFEMDWPAFFMSRLEAKTEGIK